MINIMTKKLPNTVYSQSLKTPCSFYKHFPPMADIRDSRLQADKLAHRNSKLNTY